MNVKNLQHTSLRHEAPIAILIILMAFWVAYSFFFTTSPFYFEPESGDSARFLMIGRYWGEGYLPYVSLFDNKGPLLLFLNRWGYALTGTRSGVCLIEAVFLSATLLFAYRLLRKAFSKLVSVFLLFFVAIRFGTINYGGNGAEEYCMPFLMASFLFIATWNEKRKEGDNAVPLSYAFFWGLTFGVCWLTRVTNAIGLCVALLFIAGALIIRRDWRTLLRSTLLFMAGCVSIVIPFYLYFFATGTFPEMFYATILCNIDYVFHSPNDPLTLSRILHLCLYFRDTTIAVLVTVLYLIYHRNERRTTWLWLVVSLVTLLWLINGKGYAPYGLISMPLLPITFILLKRFPKDRQRQTVKAIANMLMVFLLLIISVSTYKIAFTGSGYGLRTANRPLEEMRKITAGLPMSYKQSFIAYNCPEDWYLYEHIRPYYPHFSLQDFSSFSPRLSAMILQTFQQGNAEWILVRGEAQIIRPVLKEHYHAVRRYDNLTLYRRN